MEKFEFNKANYYYLDNQANGVPVFFLHGNSAGKEVFTNQLNSLSNSGVRIIIPDLPGCGDNEHSKQPEIDNTLKNYLLFLESFIRKFKFSKYVIIAHSLSGHLVLECADILQGLAGLVLFGTPPLGTSQNQESPFLPNEVIPLLFKKILDENEINNLTKQLCSNNETEISLITSLLIKSDGAVRQSFAVALEKGEFKDEAEIFRNLKIPKMIIHAEKDKFINSKYLEQFSEFLFDKKINYITNSNHYLQIEHSEEFNKLIMKFIDKIK